MCRLDSRSAKVYAGSTRVYAAIETICIALSILLNTLAYVLLFFDDVDYSYMLGRSFGHSMLCLGSIMYALMHLFIIFVSIKRFLLDGHRRKRMGLFGVAHALANLAAIILSYHRHPLQPDGEFWERFTAAIDGTFVRKAHASCILASAAGSVSLLWMVPAVSKKLSRFFTCATLTTATIALSLMYYVYSQIRPLLLLVGVVSTVYNTINFIDVWSSFVLLHFERSFKKNASMKERRLIQKRSPVYQHTIAYRFLWRSFRKTDLLLHLFPPKDSFGAGKATSIFDVKTEHAVMKPTISWLLYTLGETGSVITFLYYYFKGVTGDDDFYTLSVIFNFYASVTFLVTMALKGTVSKSQFRALLAYNILATSFMNLYQVDKGTVLAFFWVVLVESFVGFTVMAVTFLLSEGVANN